ncbi:hypothetical protein [Devosia sp.]|uniref:MotE family protein n=1 Tax=Devosia sp. TaxID=1871048 RepID=UPI0025F07F07|nr:hypothetical protein [Devosia sp.]MCR6634993.1 hypothetical protein [Devosia sp.]
MTLTESDPVLNDQTPTLELTTAAPDTTVSNSIVSSVALSPDRCAVEVEIPTDGTEFISPEPAIEGEARDCADLTDAVPMAMTPEGPRPLGSPSSESTTEDVLLLRLGERKAGLDAEKASLEQQALLLDAAERRIQERTAKLTELEQSMNDLIGARDQQSQEEIAGMVSLYQNMKPQQAALVMGGLPDPILLQIASAMSPRKMSAIMAELNPVRAQNLTVMMMDRAGMLEALGE